MAVLGIAISDSLGPERGEPSPWLEIRSTPVSRPKSNQSAPDQLLDRHHSDPALGGREAAVEAVVAIVAHQKDVACRDRGFRKVVRDPVIDLIEHGVAWTPRQGFQEGMG